MSLVAGSARAEGFTDGLGSVAQFRGPGSIAVDGSGTVYVADQRNLAIRKVTRDGVVSTLAGAQAGFVSLGGIALDGQGNLLVVDAGDFTLRRITPDGTVSTFAGASKVPLSVDGPLAQARFAGPLDVAVGAKGDIYVAENAAIRKITPAGTVSTLLTTTYMSRPLLAVGPQDSLYLLSDSDTLRRYDAAGRPVAWPGTTSLTLSQLPAMDAITVDAAGTVYLGQGTQFTGPGNPTQLHRLWKLSPDGQFSPLAGGGLGWADGQGTAARFNRPADLAMRADGGLLVADSANDAIRTVSPGGAVTTLAGGSGRGLDDGVGTAARFAGPAMIAASPDGTLWVRDFYDFRRVSPTGAVTTIGASSRGLPVGLAADASGRAYASFTGGVLVLDGTGAVVNEFSASTFGLQAVTPAGAMLFAINSSQRLSAVRAIDTPGATARLVASGFNRIADVSVAPDGGILVADQDDHTLLRVAADGSAVVVAGAHGSAGAADGLPAVARLDTPTRVTADDKGNLYFTDRTRAVGKVWANGWVTTLLTQQQLPAGVIDLVWVRGALYALSGSAVVRIAPLE